MIESKHRTAVIGNAWYPALALDGGEAVVAWRAFDRDAPLDEPERVMAAKLRNGRPGRAVVVATGHFHRAPRLVRAAGKWRLLAIRRDDGAWRLVRVDLDESLKPNSEAVLSPAGANVTAFDVAGAGRRQHVVWAEAGPEGRAVRLRPLLGRGAGALLAQGAAWQPALVAFGRGELAAAWEDDGEIRLRILKPDGETVAEATIGLEGRRLGWPAVCAAGPAVCLACQSNGTWGQQTERLNEDTRLHVFRWEPAGEVQMAGGQPNGEVPVCTRSRFTEYREETPDDRVLPLAPSIAADEDGGVSVLFRHYRDAQMNDWGWTLRAVHGSPAGFGPPEDVSAEAGHPDGQYAMARAGDGWVAAVAEAVYPVSNRSFASRGGTRPPSIGLYSLRMTPGEGQVPWVASSARARAVRMGGRWRTLPGEWRGRTLVWADLHRHTWQSRCAPEYDADFADHCRWARDCEGLGSLAFTDHWFGNSCNGEQRVSLANTEANREPGRFVPLFGVEVSWRATGHVNIYSPDRRAMAEVSRMWRQCSGNAAEAVKFIYENGLQDDLLLARHFHGMTFGEGPMQILGNALARDDRVEPVIEVVQTRGDCLPWYCRMLRAGQRKGVIGGSDHCRAPDRKTPFCLTGLWVEQLTPAGLWEALRGRCCFATNGARIELRLSLGEALMGATVPDRPGDALRWEAASERPLKEVLVYRDGFCVERLDCAGRLTAGGATGGDGPASRFIVARDAEGGLAVSSPIWTEPAGG